MIKQKAKDCKSNNEKIVLLVSNKKLLDALNFS